MIDCDALHNNDLNPAIEAGLIQMTLPDKPTGWNQGYITKQKRDCRAIIVV